MELGARSQTKTTNVPRVRRDLRFNEDNVKHDFTADYSDETDRMRLLLLSC